VVPNIALVANFLALTGNDFTGVDEILLQGYSTQSDGGEGILERLQRCQTTAICSKILLAATPSFAEIKFGMWPNTASSATP
jgi:hypothetical protein